MPSNRQIRRKIEHDAAPDRPRRGNAGKVTAAVLVAVALLVAVPVALSQLSRTDAQQPMTSTSAEPSASAQGPQPSEPTPSQPQGVTQIPAFDPPPVDTSDPESVARGWAYTYHSRNAEDDYARLSAAEGYIPEELRHDLLGRATSQDSPLAGLGASHLEGVEFRTSTTQSTPIRWARNATVTVQTEAGRTLVIEYAIQVDATEAGWTMTQATEQGWAEGE